MDLTGEKSSITRKSPRLLNTVHREQSSLHSSKARPGQSSSRAPLASARRGQQFFRVRESLVGSFALEDLDSPEAKEKAKKVWKMIDVKVLDLC